MVANPQSLMYIFFLIKSLSDDLGRLSKENIQHALTNPEETLTLQKLVAVHIQDFIKTKAIFELYIYDIRLLLTYLVKWTNRDIVNDWFKRVDNPQFLVALIGTHYEDILDNRNLTSDYKVYIENMSKYVDLSIIFEKLQGIEDSLTLTQHEQTVVDSFLIQYQESLESPESG